MEAVISCLLPITVMCVGLRSVIGWKRGGRQDTFPPTLCPLSFRFVTASPCGSGKSRKTKFEHRIVNCGGRLLLLLFASDKLNQRTAALVRDTSFKQHLYPPIISQWAIFYEEYTLLLSNILRWQKASNCNGFVAVRDRDGTLNFTGRKSVSGGTRHSLRIRPSFAECGQPPYVRGRRA